MARAAAALHRRWTTVLDAGDLHLWVGVSDAPLADFERGVVHGRQVDADGHCTPDCPGCDLGRSDAARTVPVSVLPRS